MMEAIGWLSFAFVGAYLAATLGAMLAIKGGMSGLQDIPGVLLLAAVSAISWLAFVAWLSPLSIGWAQ
jgi:hypothetical protein